MRCGLTGFGAGMIAVLLVIAGCAQVEFNLELVDTKTMMENQIIGSYEELGEDVWLVTNVRSGEDELPPLDELAESDPERARALTAYADSLFLDEELRRLKASGQVGETAEGYLAVTPLGVDYSYGVELVERENANRLVIFERLADNTADLVTDDPVAEVAETYGRLFTERRLPGYWYRDAAGEWSLVD